MPPPLPPVPAEARVATLWFDMNSFFASVAQQEEPALIGRPVGVLTTDAPGAACIAASVEAKRHGVRMGTRREEARRLCPGIVFRAVRHDVCVDYHHRIRAAAERVVPIDKAHSVDEFSCRLTGRQQRLETALSMGRDLQAALLRDLGPAMRCSVGLGPNRLLAKIAAGLEKPGGLHWLLPQVLPGRIAHLPLTALPGISRGISARLERAGITDIPTLLATDPRQARAIWHSVTGERFLRELRGETVDYPATRRSSFGHGQVLTTRNRTPEAARLVARRLLVKAAARLRREGMFARSLHVGLRAQDAGWSRDAHRGEETQFPATQDSFALLSALEDCWRRLRVTAPPGAVSVMLGGLVPAAEHVPDLFEDRAHGQPTGRETLCAAIDMLNRRFGQDTVRIGELPVHRVPYTGAKIAFGRIPEREDFLE